MIYSWHDIQNELLKIQGRTNHPRAQTCQCLLSPSEWHLKLSPDLPDPIRSAPCPHVWCAWFSKKKTNKQKNKHSSTSGSLHLLLPLPGALFLLMSASWLPHFPWVLACMSSHQEGSLNNVHKIAPLHFLLPPILPILCIQLSFFFFALTPNTDYISLLCSWNTGALCLFGITISVCRI